MGRKAFLLGSVAVAALVAAMPEPELTGWYGAVDAGYHSAGRGWS